MDQLKQQVEALLFASEEPLSVRRIQSVLPETKPAAIKDAISVLEEEYRDRGFAVEELAGGFQLLTRSEHADIISALRKSRGEKKISPAALETLAIVAYKQPIKRVDVEAVRGVQSGELLRALMERGLVRVVGRENLPGNPVLYGTTDEFLKAFGLASLDDLPKPEDVQ